MAHVVLGAAGFTGRQLVKQLVELGEEVIASDLRPRPADTPHGVPWFVADLCQPESVAGLPYPPTIPSTILPPDSTTLRCRALGEMNGLPK